jgi:hypothetical protein
LDDDLGNGKAAFSDEFPVNSLPSLASDEDVEMLALKDRNRLRCKKSLAEFCSDL